MFVQRLTSVHERIARACRRTGRSPSRVALLAVTKTVPAQAVREAIAAGIADIGESRVQEARDKQAELADAVVRWHLIGHLQRNKAATAARLFDAVHSLDSAELAADLNAARASGPKSQRLEVFIQVALAGEAQKFGCSPEAALKLAEKIPDWPHLRLVGLMTIPPYQDDPEAARPVFKLLYQLRAEAGKRTGMAPTALKLSMGMSHDFEVAIEEGADIVRVGTALFGARSENTGENSENNENN